MKKDANISNRKKDHIRINLEENVKSGMTTGLENYRLIHQALPEISLNEVDLSQQLFGKILSVPLLVSSMTGGTDRAGQINHILALAAQEVGCCMGVGSQRAAIEDPSLEETYKLRKYAPDILLFANLGAVQLNYGFGIDQCKKAVDMIEANALILHLNPLQEALQPEGDWNFHNLVDKIRRIKRELHVPLIVKEVGWGISKETAQQLSDVGVDGVDVAGSGGTSWSQVEMHRLDDPYKAQTAGAFIDWGIPTAESIQNAREVNSDWNVFASGGLQNGIDIAKSIALGANLGGMAGIFLRAADKSVEETVSLMKMIVEQIQIAMFASGSRSLKDLTREKLQRIR